MTLDRAVGFSYCGSHKRYIPVKCTKARSRPIRYTIQHLPCRDCTHAVPTAPLAPPHEGWFKQRPQRRRVVPRIVPRTPVTQRQRRASSSNDPFTPVVSFPVPAPDTHPPAVPVLPQLPPRSRAPPLSTSIPDLHVIINTRIPILSHIPTRARADFRDAFDSEIWKCANVQSESTYTIRFILLFFSLPCCDTSHYLNRGAQGDVQTPRLHCEGSLDTVQECRISTAMEVSASLATQEKAPRPICKGTEDQEHKTGSRNRT